MPVTEIKLSGGVKWSDIEDPPTIGPTDVAWDDIEEKPTSFTPAEHSNTAHNPDYASEVHSHEISGVTGLESALNGKQATLVSGTNIKSINGTTILGSGDMTISGGGGEEANVEVLSANKTLTASDKPIQIYTCTADRDINLPTTGLATYQKFTIWNKNAYTTTYQLILKQSATTITQVSAETFIILYWDGTNWKTQYNLNNISIGSSGRNNYGGSINIGGDNSHTGSVNIGGDDNYNYAVSIGRGNSSNRDKGVAVGYGITGCRNYSVGVGFQAYGGWLSGVALGAETNAQRQLSIALGRYTKTERYGEIKITSGESQTANNDNMGFLRFKRADFATAAGAWQNLYLEGASSNSKAFLDTVEQHFIQINAVDLTTNTNCKTWTISVMFHRGSGIVGTPVKTVVGASANTTNWDVQVVYDNVNYAFNLQVKHDMANNVRFGAHSMFHSITQYL